ncbi:non-classical arabinogalactan protein 30-like [Lotus japonicus]|uniref:non-classical arabinogalactan protein 30-like n=1 Tax=Lotus japonicus TaxID=34305 RepID=UPI0025908057|nr:non-classical arabinogalactan protein 30-like [Lotus japonicus]
MAKTLALFLLLATSFTVFAQDQEVLNPSTIPSLVALPHNVPLHPPVAAPPPNYHNHPVAPVHPPTHSPIHPPAHAPHHHHHHHPPAPAPAPIKPPVHPPTSVPVKPPTGHHHHHHPPSPAPAPAPAHHHYPPTPAPVHPPVHPFPRSFVAVQGVVFTKSCKYAGVDTLLGATPISGAVVKLECNNTRYRLVQKVKTDHNGYFYLQAPKTITTFGAHKCKVFLVSAPAGLKPSNLHGGVIGSGLRPVKPFLYQKLPFLLYNVGPLAFEPTCPGPH